MRNSKTTSIMTYNFRKIVKMKEKNTKFLNLLKMPPLKKIETVFL